MWRYLNAVNRQRDKLMLNRDIVNTLIKHRRLHLKNKGEE